MSPSSSQDQKLAQLQRKEMLTRTPDTSVRSCGRMGETDTHGETREGGAPSPLTHPRRLPSNPGSLWMERHADADADGPATKPGQRESGIVGHARSVAASRGAEYGELQAWRKGASRPGPASQGICHVDGLGLISPQLS